jgi:hypothetical protein
VNLHNLGACAFSRNLVQAIRDVTNPFDVLARLAVFLAAVLAEGR